MVRGLPKSADACACMSPWHVPLKRAYVGSNEDMCSVFANRRFSPYKSGII